MKSNPPVPTSGSRLRAQNSRTLGSMAFMRFGGEHPATAGPVHVCAGGSSKRMMPGGISMSALISSSTEPLPEM